MNREREEAQGRPGGRGSPTAALDNQSPEVCADCRQAKAGSLGVLRHKPGRFGEGTKEMKAEGKLFRDLGARQKRAHSLEGASW